MIYFFLKVKSVRVFLYRIRISLHVSYISRFSNRYRLTSMLQYYFFIILEFIFLFQRDPYFPVQPKGLFITLFPLSHIRRAFCYFVYKSFYVSLFSPKIHPVNCFNIYSVRFIFLAYLENKSKYVLTSYK